MVCEKVQRLKKLLSLKRRPNNLWRPEFGLLQRDQDFPRIEKGYPLFDTTFPFLRQKQSSFKKYKMPDPPKPPMRLPEEYNEDCFHELLGKFCFEVKGRFPDKGVKAEQEVFMTAFDLHLVGWLKVRSASIFGHVQGDAMALAYYKRWLEEKHLSPESGTIEWVRLFQVNTGLEPPLQYKHLIAIKDRRKYAAKKRHFWKGAEKLQAEQLETLSALHREKEERKLEHCTRNY